MVAISTTTRSERGRGAPASARSPQSPPALWQIVRGRDGAEIRRWPHPGQWRALTSDRRFVFMLAGTQGGKTSLGPLWLADEIAREGPGDYLAVTSTFPLMRLKMFPAFMQYFDQALGLGQWHAGDRAYEISPAGGLRLYGVAEPSRVIFGSATNANSLESATAKAAWLDEVGQDDFRLESWEAILRRLSLHQGRVLGGTTLYNLGWLRHEVYERWLAGDPAYDVIQFDSLVNPLFPREEYLRAKATMPGWRFNLFYRGRYARPAGLIYHDFIDRPRAQGGHLVAPFAVPADWPRVVGIDFGGVHTATVWLAYSPAERVWYLYQERLAGDMTSAQHAAAVAAVTRGQPAAWWGGAPSEDQWRLDWKAAGVPVRAPLITEVEAGIDRVVALFKANRLFVFNTCRGVLSELGTYSRELDERGEPTEKIKDKTTYHRLDALRYAVQGIGRGGLVGSVVVGGARGWQPPR